MNYIQTNAGVFDTVVGGPASVPYAVGWALLITGTLWSLVTTQAKIAAGQRVDPLQIVVNSGILAAGLGLYTFIARSVWWATQSLAHSIFPAERMSALGGALKGIMEHQFNNPSGFSLSITENIKDAMVYIVGTGSWLTAIVSHWTIQTTQQGVYNVIFIFGPLLIGAGAWGLPTPRIWLMALVEVSSWSISAAALYFGLQTQFDRYLQSAHSTSLLDGQFLDVIAGLSFLSLMMLIVPVLTGRLLGASTLGELSRVQPGATMAAGITSFMRNKMSGGQPPNPQQSRAPNNNQGGRRPGDQA